MERTRYARAVALGAAYANATTEDFLRDHILPAQPDRFMAILERADDEAGSK